MLTRFKEGNTIQDGQLTANASRQMFVKICHSAGSGDGLGRIDLVKHRITTGDALSIKQPPRRISFHMREEADTVTCS